MNWLEDIWTMHRKNSRTRGESWERRNLLKRWRLDDQETKTTHEMLRMCKKNSHNQKQLWEDGIKLEPWIFKRTDQDLGEILLRSSNVDNHDEKHQHELLRHSGTMDNKNDEPTMKEFERSWRKTYEWWKFILTSNFEMNLRITPEKLEESGKILEKDLWVRAHSKEPPLKWLLEEEIAPT